MEKLYRVDIAVGNDNGMAAWVIDLVDPDSDGDIAATFTGTSLAAASEDAAHWIRTQED